MVSLEAPLPIFDPKTSIKDIGIENEGKKFICKAQTIKEFLHISLLLGQALIYEGYISLLKIQTQIGIIDYNINEIFGEIYILNDVNFSLIKEEGKYKLKIKFLILRKEKYLIIDLEESKNKNITNDLISQISELKEIIKKKDGKIKSLEEEIKNYNKEETKESESAHHTERSLLPSNETKKLKNINTNNIGPNNEGSVIKTIKECNKSQHSTLYDLKFFSTRDERTRFAAKKILLNVMKHFRVKSAVDFGCGTGTFLKFLKDNGVSVTGLDGDYIDRKILAITEEEFIPVDLTKPVHLSKKYDLSISLEVAEHLPESSAETFITSLCEASHVVLFSAAVKGQGGVGHVNEQFLSYWQKIFLKKEYYMLDIIRPEIWNDEKIPPYYRQNIVIFVYVDTYKILPESVKTENKIIDVIHPYYAK
jgi:2-polyprenyl-3-methyl-5-hydroxy-6-metoxy-1,4-benzoquinol methylase